MRIAGLLFNVSFGLLFAFWVVVVLCCGCFVWIALFALLSMIDWLEVCYLFSDLVLVVFVTCCCVGVVGCLFAFIMFMVCMGFLEFRLLLDC